MIYRKQKSREVTERCGICIRFWCCLCTHNDKDHSAISASMNFVYTHARIHKQNHCITKKYSILARLLFVLMDARATSIWMKWKKNAKQQVLFSINFIIISTTELQLRVNKMITLFGCFADFSTFFLFIIIIQAHPDLISCLKKWEKNKQRGKRE